MAADERLPDERLSDQEQLRLLREALSLSQEAFALSDLDEGGAFLDCSPAAHQRLGYSRAEYLALGPAGLQADPEHDATWVAAHLDQMRRQPSGSFHTRHRCRDGRAIEVVVDYRVLEHRGRRLVLALHRDRSELLHTLHRAERLHELLLDAEQLTGVGSWELIHATGELVWSAGTFRIFEAIPGAFIPSYERFLAAVHPEDREIVDRAYRTSLQTRQPYQVNHRLRLADGREKVVQERGTTSFDASGAPLRSIGTVQDITQLVEYERKLERAAYIDPLTELPNRQAALRYLQEALQDGLQPQVQAAIPPTGMGVFNLDLDQFQAFNDSFGPQAGDRLLVAVSRILRRDLSPDAFLARLESDEFLILEKGDLTQLEAQARRLQQLLSKAAAEFQHLPLLPSVSIGVSHLPSHGVEPQALLQAANTALMESKRRCKGGVCLYSDAISLRIRQQLALEAELEQAVSEKAFRLVFQPQVNRQGELIGAEVLLRWHDHHGSPIPPSVFIPLAERSGQIHAIGAWVIEESCRQLVAWRRQGLQVPRLAINLSATQLCLPDGELARTLIATVRRHGLEPEAFELEITETALIHDPETSREETMALHRAGFQLAIDDFGTGYASLVSLHLLPVDKIKIDLSFIQRLQANDTDHTIVKSTILLAQELGLQAMAEGVESEEQWRILQELGCDLYQGYLFGFPMAPEAFEERLRASGS